jgi:hypothetical protein
MQHAGRTMNPDQDSILANESPKFPWDVLVPQNCRRAANIRFPQKILNLEGFDLIKHQIDPRSRYHEFATPIASLSPSTSSHRYDRHQLKKFEPAI